MNAMDGDSTILERLVETFVARRRAGERIVAAVYAAEHPDHAPHLLEALEAAELLSNLGSAAHPLGANGACAAPGIGARFGRFELLRELGRGGMGVVWEAFEEPLARRVALKFLPPELLGNATSRARFQREAELTARLAHPSVGSVLAVELEGPAPFIAMALIEGESLAAHIVRAREEGRRLALGCAEGQPQDARALAGWFACVARALAHAHERGVIHRDVKPGNLMVAEDGRPVLVDFGLARELEQDGPSLTLSGETAGTPSYLAPELISGHQVRPDAQTDVYALGVALFEALTLRRPFEAPTREALYREILSGPQPRLRSQRPDLPRDLVTVVETAFTRDRRHRYADATALAADLEAVRDDRPVAARPVGSIVRALRWARREPRQAALIGVLCSSLLVAALAGGAYIASRDDVLAAESLSLARQAERAIALGFSCLTDRDFAGADVAFAEARELDPGLIEAHAGRVLVSLSAGRPEQALERLAAAPDLPVFERLRAMARGEPVQDDLESFEAPSAVELFLEGERLFVESERLPPTAARARAAEALAHFDEAVRRAPAARSLYHVRRANAAQVAGDLEAARSAARALLTLWPDAQRELSVAGFALCELDPVMSRRLLQRAFELDPTHQATLQGLGIACLLSGDPGAAEVAFRAELRMAPEDHRAHNNLGLSLVDLGRFDEARSAYERAIELEPGRVQAWANLSDLEALAGDHAAAERARARAVEADPEDPVQRYNWAVSLRRVDRHAEAVEQWRWLLEREYEVPTCWWGLAVSQRALGARVEALASTERALEDLPDEERLHELRRLLREEISGAPLGGE